MEHNKTFVLPTLYHNPVVVTHTHGVCITKCMHGPTWGPRGGGGGGGAVEYSKFTTALSLYIYIATSVSRTANTWSGQGHLSSVANH